MKAVAALVAIALIMLSGLLAGPALAGPALAAPAVPDPVTDAGPLRLDIAELGPRIVTADGPTMLSMVGTITNTDDEPVDGLVMRVQRGDPLDTEGAVRDALAGTAATDTVVPEFVDLPGVLAPGAQAPVRLAVALRGDPRTTLALSRTGVHELLINVNGVPSGGDRARLAAVRMLLPVLSLPPVTEGELPAPPAPPARTVGVTLLYPIADVPHRLPTVPGEPGLLSDDELAASFAPGGRLYGLVTALEQRAPTGSPVRTGICLAVDADLVATAAAMRTGYEVLTPDRTRVPGSGGTAAGQWLDTLTTVARNSCVLALPFADADLVALSRGDLRDQASAAVTDGRALLASTLGTTVLTDTTWPADGVLDERALTDVVAPQGRAVVLSADGVASGRGARLYGVVPVAAGGRPQIGVLTDPLLTLAAAGPGGAAPDLTGRDRPIASTPAGTATPLSTQDLIGALAFRAESAPAPQGAEGTAAPSIDPLVLAPPHLWAADGTGAAALLTSMSQLISTGALAPRALEQVIGAATNPVATPQRLVYPLRAGGREVPPGAVDTIRTTRESLLDLRSAAVAEGGVGVGVEDVFGPLSQGLVRGASAAWRGRPELAVRAAAAGELRIQQLRAAVRVLEPPSPYALGTTDAPLLLTVANGLPISMRVHVELSSTSGLRVTPIPEQVIPPLGRRQVQASAKVTRSGQFVVDASVRSPDGRQLGPPSRLRVRSTAYGTITVWLTGTAGVLLVVLVARRILRRVRGEPGPERIDPDLTTQLPALPARPTLPTPPAPTAVERTVEQVPATVAIDRVAVGGRHHRPPDPAHRNGSRPDAPSTPAGPPVPVPATRSNRPQPAPARPPAAVPPGRPHQTQPGRPAPTPTDRPAPGPSGRPPEASAARPTVVPGTPVAPGPPPRDPPPPAAGPQTPPRVPTRRP